MIYEYLAQNSIKKIERYRDNAQDEANGLERLERASKKNGEPFANIDKNYPNAHIRVHYSLFDGTISSVEINGPYGKKSAYGGRVYHEITLYLPDALKVKEITFEILENLIAKEVSNLRALAQNYQRQLKAANKAFAKVDQAVSKVKTLIKSLPGTTDESGRLSTLGYALQDYVAKSL